jgi:hypothetical protein
MNYDLITTFLASIVAIISYGIITNLIEKEYGGLVITVFNFLIGYFTNKK